MKHNSNKYKELTNLAFNISLCKFNYCRPCEDSQILSFLFCLHELCASNYPKPLQDPLTLAIPLINPHVATNVKHMRRIREARVEARCEDQH